MTQPEATRLFVSPGQLCDHLSLAGEAAVRRAREGDKLIFAPASGYTIEKSHVRIDVVPSGYVIHHAKRARDLRSIEPAF